MTIDHVFEVLPTWLCLKGAVASLGIGAILYVFVVRTSLMRTNKDGHREYVNVWPVWLDIENQIYRPLLLNVLPFFGALFARFVGSIPGWIASFGYKLASKFFAFDSKSLAAATAPVWEGEADIVSVIKSMDIVTAKIEQKRAQELAAKEVEEGHGHHGHAHEEDQKPSFGERFVASARGEKIDDRTFIGKICDFLGIREDYTEVLRSSVTSSLALFAIGAAIIILIVILL